MEQESLDKASNVIFTALDKLNIDTVDKIDLLINLKALLEDKDRYTESIKVLQRNIKPKRSR